MSDLLKSFEEHSTYNQQISKNPIMLSEDKVLHQLEDVWQNEMFEDN